jgi:hypothetical protein
VSRTSFLVAIAVIVLLMQFFPNQASTIRLAAIGLGLVYLVIRTLRTYPAQYRQKKKRAAQEDADAEEYRQYTIELDAIRAQYDPSHKLDKNSEIPQDYRNALSALHDKYQAMLDRKFGPGR